jgi:uncharacterized membrane protein YdcZ (DUF606 family)
MRLVGFAALFAAGLLVAGVAADVVGAHTATDITTTTTVTQPTTATSTVEETTTVHETTTSPGTTVLTTTTVAPATTAPTTTSSTESSGTPAWVWVLVALLGAGVIALAALLYSRSGSALPDSERRLRLQGAINSWAAQGWALTSETMDTAVMQRGGEHMMLTVDPAGQVVSRPASAQPPRASAAQPPQGQPPAEQPTREMRPEDNWPGDT